MGLFNGQVFQETRIEGLLEESKAQVQSSVGLVAVVCGFNVVESGRRHRERQLAGALQRACGVKCVVCRSPCCSVDIRRLVCTRRDLKF